MLNNLLCEYMRVFRFVLGCIKMCLRGEGRRDWEVDLRYEGKKKHMITLESIEFIFLHILYLYSLILDCVCESAIIASTQTRSLF